MCGPDDATGVRGRYDREGDGESRVQREAEQDGQKPGASIGAVTRSALPFQRGSTARPQVSECIKLLQSDGELPIQRARMRLRVSIPAEDEPVAQKIVESAETVESDQTGAVMRELVRPDIYFYRCPIH